MEKISYDVGLLISLGIVYFGCSYALLIFQQNRYEIRRLISWIKEYFDNLSIGVIGFIVYVSIWVVAFFVGDIFNITEYLYLVLIVVFLLQKHFKQQKQDRIIPLKITQRVQRQIIVIIIFTILIYYGVYRLNLNSWLFIFYILLPVIVWLLVLLMAIITLPFEMAMQRIYLRKARVILKNLPNLIKVGITGSYGKTSSKNILQSILSEKFYSLMTPASFNTPMGITITIREQLKSIHEVFICEMGADKVGEIKFLSNFVKPQYGIVTSIGYQHLLTFNTIENIINEKMSLIESLPLTGVGFLNRDNEYIRNYYIKNKCKIVWFGIESSDVDYRATDVRYLQDGSTFNITTEDGGCYPFKTKLLGEHNIMNIVAAVAVGRELDLEWELLQDAVSQIEQISNRLQQKIINGLHFIDNAFNSNPVGARMSVDVLNMMPGTRYIITPGLIDLGEKQFSENKELGKYMATRIDKAILVGINQSRPIKEGLIEEGFDENSIIVFKTVKEAFSYVYQHASSEDTILIENDLPDAFNN